MGIKGKQALIGLLSTSPMAVNSLSISWFVPGYSAGRVSCRHGRPGRSVGPGDPGYPGRGRVAFQVAGDQFEAFGDDLLVAAQIVFERKLEHSVPDLHREFDD